MKNGLLKLTTVCLILALLIAENLCPAIAASSTTVEISNTVSYDKGTSTISWTTSGTKPSSYHVFAQAENHGSSAQALLYLGEVQEQQIQTTSLAPGISYLIAVVDEEFSLLGEGSCAVPEVPDFEDGKLKSTSIKISVIKRSMDASTGKFKEVKQLSGQAIAESFEAGVTYYGVKYQMRMPQLAKDRAFFGTLVFESPDGFIYVDRAMDMTFERVNDGYQTLWWNLAGFEFFYELFDTVGYIPAGTYTIHLYWDGMFVNTITFDVDA